MNLVCMEEDRIPRRKYEIIEPYFLPNFMVILRCIREKNLIDRMDIESPILHLLYCIQWCNRRPNDYWIQKDREILEQHIIELVSVFKERLPEYYNEFKEICPGIVFYEKNE